jgi:hypothetical protein
MSCVDGERAAGPRGKRPAAGDPGVRTKREGSVPGCQALANAVCLRGTNWYAMRRAGASEAVQISANRGEWRGTAVAGVCILLQGLTDSGRRTDLYRVRHAEASLNADAVRNSRQLELKRRVQMMKLRKLTLATILASGLAGIAATKASAAPVNGRAITTASPSLTTEVQYWSYPGYSNWGYPGYSYRVYPGYSYWGYPGYSYWGYGGYQYPTYGYYGW